MKSRKRERLEILYNVLVIINTNKEINPTPLLRKSNLTTSRFNIYIEELITKQLIIINFTKKGKKLIRLSEKGIEFLDKFKEIVSILEDFDIW